MIGNLTRDPEYKQLTSGQPVCRLGLATNRQFKNRQTGSMVQEVCYIDIDVWGPQAESCRQYLQKGRSVLIEGRLKLDSWQDQNGQNRSKHSIVADRVVFLSGASAHQEDEMGAEPSYDSLDAKSQDVMAQVEQMKAKVAGRTAGVKAAKKAEPAKEYGVPGGNGEMAFQDEPPFQDDLPF
jgi:single-strand DNA-binding protein